MQKVLLDAVTATTTSDGFNVENLEDITFQMYASGISSGNGAFTFAVSNDGIIWTALNLLVSNVTNAISEGTTRVAGVSVTANASAGSKILNLERSAWKMIRATVTVTTDGTYSCILSANKKVR